MTTTAKNKEAEHKYFLLALFVAQHNHISIYIVSRELKGFSLSWEFPQNLFLAQIIVEKLKWVAFGITSEVFAASRCWRFHKLLHLESPK